MEGSLFSTGTGFVVPGIPELVIERLQEGAILPKYATEGDSGMDFFSPEDVLIRPGERKVIRLGIAMEIPQHPFYAHGYRWELQIRPKSGIASKTLLVSVLGTVDNFYRDEIGVIVHNDAQQVYEYELDGGIRVEEERIVYAHNTKGEKVHVKDLPDMPSYGWRTWYAVGGGVEKGTVYIPKGAKFAQGVLNEVIRPLAIVEGKVSRDLDRGGGFGSTGV